MNIIIFLLLSILFSINLFSKTNSNNNNITNKNNNNILKHLIAASFQKKFQKNMKKKNETFTKFPTKFQSTQVLIIMYY